MAYTLASVRERILEDKLDDVGYPAAVVNRFINDAQREIFNTYELPFTEKTFSGNISSGGAVYDIPDDVQTIQTLKIVDPTNSTRDLTKFYMNFRVFNERFPVPENGSFGTPNHWTSHAGKLYFSQPTDQDYTLKLFYNKKPARLEDDADVPEVPEEFEELLVLGGYIRALERNEDFDLAAYYRDGDYTRQLDLMLFRLSKRQTGAPIIARQPSRASPIRSRRNP